MLRNAIPPTRVQFQQWHLAASVASFANSRSFDAHRKKNRGFLDRVLDVASHVAAPLKNRISISQTHPHIRASFLSLSLSLSTFSLSVLYYYCYFSFYLLIYNDASSIVTVIIVRLICSLPTPSFIRERGQTGDVILKY